MQKARKSLQWINYNKVPVLTGQLTSVYLRLLAKLLNIL
jgi:hypothetical protein